MNKGIIGLFTAVFLWGIAIAPIRWALESMGPLTLLFLRLLISSLFLLPYVYWRNKTLWSSFVFHWKHIIVLSITGVAGYYLFYTVGVDLTSAVHASILSAAIPMFTLILAFFLLKEKILIPQWCGLLMGTTGILLISVKAEMGSSSSLLGDLFVLASCLMWAFYVIHLKKIGKIVQLPNEVFTALTIAAGTILSAPLAFIEIAYTGMPVWTFSSFINLMYVALLSTVIAYLIWNWAMGMVTAASAGIWITFMPLIEVLTSVVLLNEVLTWRVLIGGLFVLFGLFWAEYSIFINPLKRSRQNRNFSQ